MLQHDISHFDSYRLGDAGDTRTSWTFQLQNEEDIEAAFIRSRPEKELTKMALARQLELRSNLGEAKRFELWKVSKDVLLAAYRAGPGAISADDLLDPAAAAAAGRET